MAFYSRWSRHLQVENWFTKHTKPDGTTYLKGRRVTDAKAVQFPYKYRQVYRERGLIELIKELRADNPSWTLSETWRHVKFMFNGPAQ